MTPLMPRSGEFGVDHRDTDGSGTVGCLLAGGLSRRMGGGDKCLLPLGKRTMLARAVERLSPQVDAMVISANGDPSRFASYRLPVLADPVEGFAGPLAGVLSAMLWARQNAGKAAWVATVASDTPFFPTDFVERSITAAGDTQTIALAVSGDRVHPVFGLWPIALADHLADWLERGESRKVLDWVACHSSVEVAFSGSIAGNTEVDPFFNVNTPQDMETASALLEEQQV